MLGIRIKVFILLLSFLGVQIISMGCTIINMAHEYAHSKITTEENHQNHSHHQHHSHDDTNSNTETDSESESCCVENATVFLQGLEATPQELKFQQNITHFIALFHEEQTFPIVLAKNILFIEIRPPPLQYLVCGILLRVFFQSFQL